MRKISRKLHRKSNLQVAALLGVLAITLTIVASVFVLPRLIASSSSSRDTIVTPVDSGHMVSAVGVVGHDPAKANFDTFNIGPVYQRPDTATLDQMRKTLIADLEKASGELVSQSTAPLDTQADFFECVTVYALASEASGKNSKAARRAYQQQIGQHLMTAHRLMTFGTTIGVRRSGLGVACEAVTQGAMTYAGDPELAWRIVEAYLLPNLHLAHPDHTEMLDTEEILAVGQMVAKKAKNPGNLLLIHRLQIEYAYNRDTADAARWLMSWSLEKLGRFDDAITVLEAREDAQVNDIVITRIARLRAQAAREGKKQTNHGTSTPESESNSLGQP